MNSELLKQAESTVQIVQIAAGYFTMIKLAAFVAIVAICGLFMATPGSAQSEKSPEEIVAALDTEYQAAVERDDVETMDRILADDFILVLGNGNVITKAELLEEARSGKIKYEKQVEIENSQKVRVWGDSTAVVTAKLWIKGTREGKPFDRKLWFSDTYVKTKDGWKYVFGQASLALPDENAKK